MVFSKTQMPEKCFQVTRRSQVTWRDFSGMSDLENYTNDCTIVVMLRHMVVKMLSVENLNETASSPTFPLH